MVRSFILPNATPPEGLSSQTAAAGLTVMNRFRDMRHSSCEALARTYSSNHQTSGCQPIQSP